MAVFAASSVITVAGYKVLGLRSVYRPMLPLIAPFRSSGRFIWPLHYMVLVLALAFVLRVWKASAQVKGAALAAVLLVQWVDVRRGDVDTRVDDRWNHLRSPRWDELARDKTKVLLHPPQLRSGGSGGCDGKTPEWPEEFYLSAGWLALRHRMALNSGYLARLDESRIATYCDEAQQGFQRGELDPSALYVVAPTRFGEAGRLRGAHCEPLDGYLACVSQPTP
jgi:hypothetical protein